MTQSTTSVATSIPARPVASFSAEAWSRITSIREAIDRLPFLTGLEDGSLPRDEFVHYLAQDVHYLGHYSRALAMCSSQADTVDQQLFWATSAARALAVETELHAAHVDDIAAVLPSPTCVAYTSYLLATATQGCHPELAASILPCFWIYQDVGTRLHERAGDLTGHPYGDWIGTYADPAFADATAMAISIVDDLAARADGSTVDRMHAAFRRATQYEWMFWDAAWRQETWPVGGP